jgi:hypothetical protein
MKNRTAFSLAFVLMLSFAAFAQDAAKSPSTRHESVAAQGFSKKAIILSGTVSDDGKFFLADPDAEVWTVTNPDLLKTQQGQRVTLQVQTNTETSEIRVLRVKPREGPLTSMAKSGDAAFRR